MIPPAERTGSVDKSTSNDGNLWYHPFRQDDLIEKLSRLAPNATHYGVFDVGPNELNLFGPAAKAHRIPDLPRKKIAIVEMTNAFARRAGWMRSLPNARMT
jgi:hypothetical protein